MSNGIIGTVKAIFFTVLITVLLGACATPYYPVYVNASGDYYITENQSSVGYYGSGSRSLRHSSLHNIGVFPWWEFSYYSPYFYPHYFSVWHPPRYDYWYGTYGWYRYYPPYYYSPYRWHLQRVPVEAYQPVAIVPRASSSPSDGSWQPTGPAIVNPARRTDAESRFREAIYRDQPRAYGVPTKTPGMVRPAPVTPRSVYRPSRTTSVSSYSGIYSGRSTRPFVTRATSRSSSTKTGSSINLHKD